MNKLKLVEPESANPESANPEKANSLQYPWMEYCLMANGGELTLVKCHKIFFVQPGANFQP